MTALVFRFQHTPESFPGKVLSCVIAVVCGFCGFKLSVQDLHVFVLPSV